MVQSKRALSPPLSPIERPAKRFRVNLRPTIPPSVLQSSPPRVSDALEAPREMDSLLNIEPTTRPNLMPSPPGSATLELPVRVRGGTGATCLSCGTVHNPEYLILREFAVRFPSRRRRSMIPQMLGGSPMDVRDSLPAPVQTCRNSGTETEQRVASNESEQSNVARDGQAAADSAYGVSYRDKMSGITRVVRECAVNRRQSTTGRELGEVGERLEKAREAGREAKGQPERTQIVNNFNGENCHFVLNQR
ncbi:hypothetical protein AURDEDRAFT_126039 [Auricularia subglabra TFB-10046 SS5]|nr:hypothetical protein AURDEDRAFT_126039 [Auricularia subglabra TFB-10046 SS5]